MFGVVRPCRHRMSGALRRAWQAHLCGLCLTLRDTHGQAARLVTSYDTLLVSVLTEAQNPRGSPHRTAGPCPLRGFRRADVVAASAPGAQLAASVSLVLAAVKITDHVADADGLAARRPVAAAASRVAARWAEQGAAAGAAIGFDTQACTGAAGRQSQLESAATPSLLAITEPAETAVAAAFAHTATLAAKPHNAPALARAGQMFGRIAHLLDAVEDLDTDHRSGRYNPLLATGTPPARARQYCDQALPGLRRAVASLDLIDRPLAEALLVTEVGRSIDRVFARAGTHHGDPEQPPAPADAPPHQPPAPAHAPPRGRRSWSDSRAADCCAECCGDACCNACCQF